ncbi:MAG: type II secretion system secretin GspD [Syntrophaceae bacterium]|jgi:general secretion pathway protein D|nr:type II secretion system secretin GspD [Syntrophaceae bacterium]
MSKMTLMKNNIGKWILCLTLIVVFTAGELSSGRAARIDEGGTSKPLPVAAQTEIPVSLGKKSDVVQTGTKMPVVQAPVETAAEKNPEAQEKNKKDSISPESKKDAKYQQIKRSEMEAILQKALKTQNDASTSLPSAEKQNSLHKKDHPSSSGTPTRKTSDKYVTLDFDNVNIEVFVKFVSELTGKNFIIDEKVKGKVTILSPRKIPLSDVYKVFLSVLEINGFATVPVGEMVKIVPSASAREKSVETRTKKDDSELDDRMVTQIITLERANPDEVKRVLDPIIPRTSSVLSYPPSGILIVTDYLSNIRRLEDIVKALDVEGAGEQITYLPLQNASATEVVKSLTNIFQQRRPNVMPIKMVADSRTNSMIILASVGDTESVRKLAAMMDKEVPRGESNIQVYRLQNSIAEDLAKVLNNIIKDTGGAAATGPAATAKISAPVVSKNVQIVPDKATNTLVIMAEREDYKVLENIIKQLDVPRPMVYIEALIMEVKANKDFKLGVEWSGVRETGSVNGSPLGSFVSSGTGVFSGIKATTDGTDTLLSLPSGFSMGIIGAGIRIGDMIFPNIGAMVAAYKYDSDVSILSTPQLLTLDNEEAEINVGENVPYLTRQDSTTTSAQYPVNYNTYEYKDVGVILNVTPHINHENYVRLKISQQVTKVISGVTTDTTKPSIPTTLKRTAKTTVVVKDNETVVIGGLVGDSTDDSTNKVPLLGDIPFLGWLFKAKTVNREKTNLYVFLTPRIVRTKQDAAKLYNEKRATMGEVVEGIIKLNERKQEQTSEVLQAPAGKTAKTSP